MKIEPKNERLKFYIKDHSDHGGGVNESVDTRYLYTFLLNSLYVLIFKGDLSCELGHKRLLFTLPERKCIKKDKDLLADMEILGDADAFVLLKDKKFYYAMKERNMRGSLFSYPIEEIEILIELIRGLPKSEDLDISLIIKNIDYQNRFNEIYNIIIEQNIKQERDDFSYFESRVKSALKIINFISDEIEIYKDGRRTYFRRK